MDVHPNNVHSRLKDDSSPDLGSSNVESCTNVHELQNNGVGLECESHLSKTSVDLSHEFKEKLRMCSTTGPINGCTKTLYNDIKNVDLSNINGLSNCHNIDFINSHVNCSDNTHSQLQKVSYELPTVEVQSDHKDKLDIKNVTTLEAANYDLECNNDSTPVSPTNCFSDVKINYVGYESEKQMPDIMRLIQKDLSEPYSIYTYRYFIHNWPKLCFLAYDSDNCVGAIVCKLDLHKKHSRRGYIAMLAVDERYRKKKIGSNLVLKAIRAMVQDNADEVVLETEITNKPALRLYENLGFVRDKRLFRYYLNGVDALRLKHWLR